MRIADLPRLSLACLLPLTFLACSDSGPDSRAELSSAAGILRFIPADTPYAFAAVTPLPDDVRDKLGEQNRAVMDSYKSILQAAFEQRGDDEEAVMDAEGRQRLLALAGKLAEMVTPDGIPQAGIDQDSTAALYGVGLLPVLRVTLSDEALFEAAFAELEAEAGEAMPTASIADVHYRYAQFDNAKLIIAANEGQLVVSFVPDGLPEDLLKAVLGLSLPARNIADSGALAELSSKYAYQSYGLGFVDFERIVSTFLDNPSGVNAELLALLDYDASELTDVCKAEIRSFAQIGPRLVAGYTDVTIEHLRSNTVLELRPDIAAGLAGLTAPVPGLGAPQSGLVSFGMSLDIPAARAFYTAQLDALEADPYECELFADLQGGVAEGRASLNQPVPPIFYGLTGFLAVIDDIAGFDFQTKQPPTDIDMRFLIATDNAEGLVAMGAMFSPEVAQLNLQADGKPVRLPLPLVAAPIQHAWVAMSDTALAFSVGEGSESRLEAMLAAATLQPSPFMSMNMDAGRYYRFLGDVIETGGADGQDGQPDVARATGEMMNSMGELFGRIAVSIQFTDRGIEAPSTVELVK